MKPDVEIYFSDPTDIMKKQNRQLIQVIHNRTVFVELQS